MKFLRQFSPTDFKIYIQNLYHMRALRFWLWEMNRFFQNFQTYAFKDFYSFKLRGRFLLISKRFKLPKATNAIVGPACEF